MEKKTYKEENGTTRVGDFLRSLGKVGKPILDMAAGLTGQEWLGKIADGIKSSSDLNDEEKAHALELHLSDAKDRAGARAMNTDIQTSDKANSMAKNAPYVLAYAITFMFGSLITFLMVKGVPESSKEVLYIMVGTLGTLVVSVFTFFFGSSIGSKAKTEGLMRSITK